MKKLISLLAFSCLLVSCKKDDNPVAPFTTNISMAGLSYSPSSISVTKGSVVKWTNNDASPHTATSDDGTTFNSGNLAAGSTYSYTTTTAGTYPYHCLVHGTMMSGTLTVTP